VSKKGKAKENGNGNGSDDEKPDEATTRVIPQHMYPELVVVMANLSLSLNALSVKLMERSRDVGAGRFGPAALDEVGADLETRGEEMEGAGGMLRRAAALAARG
jgi:hypothetical protein